MTTSPTTPDPRRFPWGKALVVVLLIAVGTLSQIRVTSTSFSRRPSAMPLVTCRDRTIYVGWPAKGYERVVLIREIGGAELPEVIAERWAPEVAVASSAFIPAVVISIALVWQSVRRRRFTLANLFLACGLAAILLVVARAWLSESGDVYCRVEDRALLEALEQDRFYRQLTPEHQAAIKDGILEANVPRWAADQWGATLWEPTPPAGA